DASFEDKKEIVSSYSGQTKQEMLEIIRSKFPLPESDKRRSDEAKSICIAIERLHERYQKQAKGFSYSQNKEIAKALRKLLESVTAAQSDLR
ncbi:MAG: CT583 family protein, partial [Verrucomicrobia bacterium]|nr:CT583 family protein [Verrucomicrobiota bacterium]